jgi:preprotein translocase subunit SecE
MARFNPMQFFGEVRQETAKVTWPTRREVWITTVLVLLLATAAALFFLAVDQIIYWVVTTLLNFAR